MIKSDDEKTTRSTHRIIIMIMIIMIIINKLKEKIKNERKKKKREWRKGEENITITLYIPPSHHSE